MDDDAGMRLIEAAMDGNLVRMAAAVNDGAPVAFQDPGGQTALFWAAMEGHSEALEWLLVQGAPVDATNEGGQTALMGAAMRWALTFSPPAFSRAKQIFQAELRPWANLRTRVDGQTTQK